MIIEEVKENVIYSSGADLWIIPDKRSSQWAQDLDWYLNFQMAKATSFKRSETSEILNQILEEEEVEKIQIESQDGKPLLIASPKHLPNLMTVIIPFTESTAKAWLNEIHNVWQELKRPSLRVFLPKGFPREKFVSYGKEHFDGVVTFVSE